MKRDPNLVSVVIPCYNHGVYVHEAIESILGQTYRHFEIIVVDDGSDDPDTIRVLQNLQFPKTRVYVTENRHLSAARNFGIKKSQGAYILPLDADDSFAPTFVEKAVRILESRPEVGVVTCHIQRFGSGDDRTYHPTGGSVTDFLVNNNSCGNSLFRHRCWVEAGGYNEAMRGFEDWDLWIGMTRKGWLVDSIPEVLFFYRNTPQSMLKTIRKYRPELFRQIVEHHRPAYREHVVDVLYQKETEIAALRAKIRRLHQIQRETVDHKVRKVTRAPLKWIRRSFAGERANASSRENPGPEAGEGC